MTESLNHILADALVRTSQILQKKHSDVPLLQRDALLEGMRIEAEEGRVDITADFGAWARHSDFRADASHDYMAQAINEVLFGEAEATERYLQAMEGDFTAMPGSAHVSKRVDSQPLSSRVIFYGSYATLEAGLQGKSEEMAAAMARVISGYLLSAEMLSFREQPPEKAQVPLNPQEDHVLDPAGWAAQDRNSQKQPNGSSVRKSDMRGV